MKLDEATAVLRPRSSWEAVDLGVALARRHWGALMRGWLTVALPLWAVIAIVFHSSPAWAMFLIGWTKPVLTRQPVFFMSRALFGAPPTVGAFWRDWRNSLCRGLPAALTFKRFAFQRAFRLPVIMLEGQTGKGYAQRVNVLGAHGGNSAAWLAFTALKLEMVITLGFAMWFNGFLTEGLFDWTNAGVSALNAIPQWFYRAATVFYVVAIALIEPMYAAAGFALYINSRTHLEGWDIEVTFRRMTSRLASAAAVVCLMFAVIAFPGNAGAAEPGGDPKSVVQEVLAGPDFELEKRRVPIRTSDEIKGRPESGDSGIWSIGTGGMNWPGYAVIGGLIAVVAWLLWKNRAGLRRGRADGVAAPSGPTVVMGMNLAPESLPEDIPQTAWREYQAGRPSEALRLLYRGALAWLVNRASLPVHESDTEGDCLRHTRQLNDAARVSFFESLTAAWINCAYADRTPAPAAMKQLCDHWPFSLRPRTAVKPSGANSAAWLIVPAALLLLQGCMGKQGAVEYEDKIMGYKGPARVNPWLAAQEMLSNMGLSARTLNALTGMPDPDTALVIPADAITSRGAARQCLNWAGNGGHLIFVCSGTDRFFNDWSEREHSVPGNYDPLLRELRVEVSKLKSQSSDKVDFGDGTELVLNARDQAGLDVSVLNTDILVGTKDSAKVASFPYFSGRVTLIASAVPFRNRWIGDADHAAIFYNITQLEPVSSVLFISRSKVNLWQMIVEHAWMPLVSTVLLVVLWLWRHLPRFGPALPGDDSRVRNFGTQLDEAGTFLSDRAGPGALLSAARRSVLQAAARAGLHAESPDLMPHLAARAGMQASVVRSALEDDSADLATSAATLQKLQQNLGVSY